MSRTEGEQLRTAAEPPSLQVQLRGDVRLIHGNARHKNTSHRPSDCPCRLEAEWLPTKHYINCASLAYAYIWSFSRTCHSGEVLEYGDAEPVQ